MSDWPKTFEHGAAPSELTALAKRLMPELLAGEHSSLSTLRAQYQVARIDRVELTGAGFYIHFRVPSAAVRVSPGDFQGGDASIQVEGLKHGMGCVLFVRSGRVAFLEGFTYEEEWPTDFRVVAVEDVHAIEMPHAGG